MIQCNPQVKLEKGKSYNLIDIDSIEIGSRYVKGKELTEYDGQSGCHFQNGDTVMARITPCLENGKIAQVQCESQKGFGSTELFVFRGAENKTDTDYVFNLMSMQVIRNLAANSMTGASGRQRADLGFIKRIKWNFPPSPHTTKNRLNTISLRQPHTKLQKADRSLANRRQRTLQRMVRSLPLPRLPNHQFRKWNPRGMES